MRPLSVPLVPFVEQNPMGTRASQLTSVCCKLMEHITFLSILDHVNSYNILNMALDQAFPAKHS